MKGSYKFIEKIGQGGNGVVSKVVNRKGEVFAKKTLKNINDRKAYSRFKDEIYVISKNLHDGVIPIIDSFLPNKFYAKNNAFYIMPLGVPLKDFLPKINLKDTFNFIVKIIDTIEFLHDNDITHRDLKIENILVVDNSPKISDFGLANFPKQSRVSKLNEKIGPAFTIAPEMKRISSNAEYKKADVYSLAKTIWVILTKQWLSFDGQYNNYSSISLINYIDINKNEPRIIGETYYFSLVILEKLLTNATHNDPHARPDIKEFKKQFLFWLESNSTYQLRNNIEWEDATNKIFPISVPESCEWSNLNDIKNVLNIIFSEYDSLNHCFFPTSGGLDFSTVEIISTGDEHYLLINSRHMMKPKKLLFESMNDIDWSYFRLEIDQCEPFFGMSVYNNEEHIYINDKIEIFEKENDSCRGISFFLSGSFLIVQKVSKINKLSGSLDHYSGLHNKLSHNEYRQLLEKIIDKFNKEFN